MDNFIHFPILEDLLRSERTSNDDLPDIDGMMKSIMDGTPVFTKTEPQTFASRPGRADMHELLSFRPGRRTRTANSKQRLAKAVAAIIIEKSRARLPAPTSPRITTPAEPDDAWSWQTELEMIGDYMPLPTTPTAIRDVDVARATGLRVTVAEDENRLAKRAASGSLSEDDYVALLLGTPAEQRLAKSAIVQWKKIQRGDEIWELGYDKNDVLIAEYLTEDKEI